MAYAAKQYGAPFAILISCALLVAGVTAFYLLSSTLKNLDDSVEKALHRRTKAASGRP